MPESPKRILVVEDNPADVMVIMAALQRLKYSLKIEVVADGQIALEYLAGKRQYKDRDNYPLPDLILLDLGLPNINGFDVLEWVRTHPDLRFTPVIILATTNLYTDIQRAYSFGANSFITKPADLKKLVEDLKTALQFWLFTASTPAPKIQPLLANEASSNSPGALN